MSMRRAAAGELKHGPIALLDADTPLVAVATREAVYSRSSRTCPRRGPGRRRSSRWPPQATSRSPPMRRDVLVVPETLEELSPVISILPLQLLAYEVAVSRGTDVDQPRNLAKSVTVE